MALPVKTRDDSLLTAEIRVHGVDGSIQSFTQHEESLVKHICEAFQPARMFTGKRITIGSEHSLTTFQASRVTRIDLVTECLFHWNPALEPVEAVELTEAAFRALVLDQRPGDGPEASRSPDDSVMALLEVVVVGGQRLFLAQEMPASPSGEHSPGFDSLFTGSSFSFLMRTGGIAVLNVANLARFTIYPGPLQIWEEVWPANHGGGRDRESHNDSSRLWGVDEREAA
jgi:hypothetical protein